MNMIQKIIENRQQMAGLMALASFVILSAALFSQYIGGLAPCQLCIYQRIPYVFVIAFGILSYGLTVIRPQAAYFFFVLLILNLFIDAGIAGFHAGVEYKWWEGLTGCTVSLPDSNASIEELREAILNAPITKCDEAAFTVLGISMAGYNFLTALGLGLVASYSLIKGK